MLFTPSFFFFSTPPLLPQNKFCSIFRGVGGRGPFSFLVGSDLETNELVHICDRGVRACLRAWVGRRAAPSLEMSWVFRDQMHLLHLPVQSRFSPSLATCLLRAPRWSRYDQGKEAERKRGQKNAERQHGGPSITETSREKIAKGIYRERISVPAPSHTCVRIIYISIKYH